MKKPKLFSKEECKVANHILITKKNISKDFPLHWHEFFEIEFILGGNGSQVLNGKKIPLKKGTVYLLTPNDFHEVYCDDTITIFAIQFSSEMLSHEMLLQLTNPQNSFIFELDRKRYDELLFLMEALYIKNTKHFSFQQNILNCILTIIIDNANLLSGKTNSALIDNTTSKAKLYMDLNFKNNPSLDDIANHVGLNRSYFNRLFYKEAKETPMSYLAKRKLSYAKNLLLSSSLPVIEIGFICGYGSFSNFSKAFKAHFQESPSEMRKRNSITPSTKS